MSIYDPDAANPDTSEEKIDQPLEQDDYATTTTPTVSCAMDTIESLQSFLPWCKVITDGQLNYRMQTNSTGFYET